MPSVALLRPVRNRYEASIRKFQRRRREQALVRTIVERMQVNRRAASLAGQSRNEIALDKRYVRLPINDKHRQSGRRDGVVPGFGRRTDRFAGPGQRQGESGYGLRCDSWTAGTGVTWMRVIGAA